MNFRKPLIANEKIISCHGLSFDCIYGTHTGGGFVAITDWGVVAELTVYNDIHYNTGKISEALERSNSPDWLPSGKKALNALARDLALIIGELISNITARPKPTGQEE
ncbi:MAG: hypothetical protein K2J37_05545 [Ruminococcus sp.]|nr:hypothetical protein [Ruminococcus sp.]MDE6783892.1 hypothetical protein [Ruminococcus sp.]